MQNETPLLSCKVMGIISTGCALCRKRRIKCDETKPACTRCVKIGKPCPGYDRGLKLVFYGEKGELQKRTRQASPTNKQSDTSISGSVPASSRIFGVTHEDVGLPSTSRAEKHADHASLVDSAVDRASTDSRITDSTIPGLRPSLSSDLEMRSLCLFVTSFVQDSQAPKDCPSFLDFLPLMYTTSAPDSCLRRTLNAVAQLNFLNHYRATATLSDWAKRGYGRALMSTNAALSDRSLAATDQTLAAVWLLSMYELIIPGDLLIGQRTPWINHVSGILQLLHIRGRKQILTQVGRQLFQLVHMPIVAMNMMLGGAPPAQVTTLNNDMLESDRELSQGPYLVSKYVQDVAVVRSKLRGWVERHVVVDAPIDHIHNLKQIVLDGLNLVKAKDFEDWARNASNWTPLRLSLSIDQPSALKVYTFTSKFVMYHWTTFWTTRMLLLQSLLNILFMVQNLLGISADAVCDSTEAGLDNQISNSSTLRTLRAKLGGLIDSTVGSVAFAFGDINANGSDTLHRTWSSTYNVSAIGAFHMFWPMGAVLGCPYATVEQKAFAREALQAIGERFCIVQALKYTTM